MVDFEKEFEKFMKTGNTNGGAIKEIYGIIPALNQGQLQIICQLYYYAMKWELDEVLGFIDLYMRLNRENKSLSFLKTMNMKQLLKAYTTDEMLRGINVNRTGGVNE